MTYPARSRAAAGAALLALVPAAVALAPLVSPRTSALEAQQPQPAQQPPRPLLLPADTATLSATQATPPSGLTVQMTQEIYVAAFRASARRWCASAGAGAGDEPMRSAAASTRLIIHGGVIERERAGVEAAVDSAEAELERGGGCSALAARPTAVVVVVDRFDGHAWNAPKSEVAPRDRGEARESGVTVVTRGVKLGRRRFHKIGAEADYTFTTERQQLVRGRYRVPAQAKNFAERWRQVQALVAADYPTLRVVAAQPAPPAPGAAPTYAARSGYSAWNASFSNPDTQALEVRMYALPSSSGRDEAWTIVVDYLGYAGR